MDSSYNPALDAALDYHRRGWTVIDIPEEEKKPGRTGWQRERWTEEQLRERFAAPRSPAILLGEPSKLLDVDLDTTVAARFADWELPATGRVFGRASKPRGHRLYRCSEPFRVEKFEDPLPEKAGGLGTILEIRGTGHQTVFPGGTHPSGEPIRWDEEDEAAEASVEELRRTGGRLAAMVLLASRFGSGVRHELTLPLAGGLARAGWSQGDVEEFIHRIGMMAGDSDPEDRRKAVESTFQNLENEKNTTGWKTLEDQLGPEVVRAVRKWLGIQNASDRPHLTDLGNAQRLVDRHGEDIRYCGAWGKWLVWDGRRWTVDDTGQIYRYAKETVRSIYGEAREEQDPDRRKEVAKWGAMSEDARRVEAMIRMARSEEGIAIRPDDLDPDPWLLNCRNGTLDLLTLELRDYRRDDHITKAIEVAYEPGAACTLWLDYPTTTMGGKTHLVDYLQRLVGYFLTGDTREKALPIGWGVGDTGKTTFSETILALLGGDFAMVAPQSTIEAKKHAGGIPNDLARLKGARLVVVSETAEGMLLDEGRVKALTGGNKITARFLNAEWFDYIPEFKLFIETNNKPRIRESGTAIWNRVKLIPFEVVIPKERQDKELKSKLLVELPGILAWAVEGCRRWQEGGLADPEEVKVATKEFRDESDLVGEFLDEMTVADPPDHDGPASHVGTVALYTAFKSWATSRGQHPIAKQTFEKRIETKGFKKTKVSTMRWNGLRLFIEPQKEGENGPD
ncbi:MAG: phage/plasmid primase, P4 family [Chloroflexota bacterium]|nr:phage/plasmid primase, P4 family [Chloroflexota bacterium]